jgi:hypothetical protein
MHAKSFSARVVVLTMIIAALIARSVPAQEPRPTIPKTWAEWVAMEDAVCQARVLSSSAADAGGKPQVIQLEVVEVSKGSPDLVKKGDRITLRGRQTVRPQDLYVLSGSKSGATVYWADSGLGPISRERSVFISHVPPVGVSMRKRLPYFMKFLDSTDPWIRDDVNEEFSHATEKALVALVPLMPRATLRKHLVDSKTEFLRMPMCGYMLGLCGKADDAEALAAKIRDNSRTPDDNRYAIGNVMVAYLMLTGEAGLDRLDEWKLKDRTTPFGEAFGALAALNTVWEHGRGCIKKERLLKSMRLLVGNAECADMAVLNLAGRRDWESLDRIVKIYGEGSELDVNANKRAVLVFARSCINAKSTQATLGQVAAAKRVWGDLRRRDPQFLEDFERQSSARDKTFVPMTQLPAPEDVTPLVWGL